MANNRLFAKCRLCGEEFCIAREFSGWAPSSLPEWMAAWAAFLEKHEACPSANTREEMGLHLQFTTENDLRIRVSV